MEVVGVSIRMFVNVDSVWYCCRSAWYEIQSVESSDGKGYASLYRHVVTIAKTLETLGERVGITHLRHLDLGSLRI